MDIVNIYWVFLLLLCFGRTHSTEDKSSECECKNGGECMTMKGIESCICKLPYKGSTCEENPCHPNPCKNNQNCTLTFNSFSCNCNEGYSGDICDQLVDLCESTTCPSEETCKIVSGVPICLKEISTSSIILSTTEKLSTTTQDESRMIEENTESSTTGSKDNTDIETLSSNEPTFTKITNVSTPNTELDEYSSITEEYLSNSSLVNSTVNIVVATEVISYENATSTIYPSITNTSLDEFNKLPTVSDGSSITDDIMTKGIDVCQQLFCRNEGKCKEVSGKAECYCPESFTGPICELATSTHLPTTTEEFNATAENNESTNDSKFNTTTEPQSTETTSEDLISSNGSSSIETFTDDLKTTTVNTSLTSDIEDATTKGSTSPDTTSDESISISSNETSSVGTPTDDSKATTENTSSTSDIEDVTTKESLSSDATSDDSISSNGTSSVGTTTNYSKTTTENTLSTSDNEEVTNKGSPSPDTTSDESVSSYETSSVGTTTDDSKTTTENTSSTSPAITSDDTISSNRPSSFGTTTDNSNINTENIYSTTSKEDNTTPDSLTAETTQSVGSTNTDDTVTELDKKKASKRNVAYICGGIGGGLGIIIFIVGIIYYLKRLKKRKHLFYFKSGDSSSMGSSDSTSHLA